MQYKTVLKVLAASVALATSPYAAADHVPVPDGDSMGIFGDTLAFDIVYEFEVEVAPGEGPSLFLLTTNFGVTEDVLFDLEINVIETSANLQFLAMPIFENVGDSQVVGGASHNDQPLAELGLEQDYHLHPQGFDTTGAGGHIAFSVLASPAVSAVPVPAAAWLFASGAGVLASAAHRRRNGHSA